ncbi:glycosyltransferase family 4 protein [Terrabacter sp. NPDC080008]|uniref:glycosyltransferase family 4 protein n=1 Tax=Terrabacter sp. NPDC080008 TaxID=3155176 RepID=UPI00344B806C
MAVDARSTPGNTSPRVALVHSFYSSRQPSGENQVVEQQLAALGRAGIETLLVDQRTDDREHRRLYPLGAAVTVATGRGPDPLRELRRFEPDVVHVHNLFPNFGRSWVSRWEGALVAHTHNFRPLCPGGSLSRDGYICTECLDRGSALPSLQHGCYRGSRVRTLPLAVSTRFAADPVLARADRVIALTEDMRDLYARAGVPAARIDVVPNFIPAPETPEPGPGGDYWLYVGRLSPEKGILELVRQWPRGRRLVVAGSGAQADAVREAAHGDVELLGHQSRSQVRELMAGALGLVFPSRCMEGLGLVALEALAAGTPVLAWPPAPAAALVEGLGVGAAGRDDVEASLDEAQDRFPHLRAKCRQVFETHFTEQVWVESVLGVYDRARGLAPAAGPSRPGHPATPTG